MPLRIKLARQLIHLWPFDRGSGRIARLLLSGEIDWPKTASFRFRYGVFVNTPIAPWPHGYRELFIYGVINRWEVEVWRRVLRAGDNVVDGGANFGYWSLVASSIIGGEGNVHAFEPVPSTYESLQLNIRASGVNNVRAYCVALSDHQGRCPINLSKNDAIGLQASLRSRTDCLHGDVVEVQLATLFEMLHDIPIRLMKLDVEGAELVALMGAMPIFTRKILPIVTFEWNRNMASAFGYAPEAIGEFLGALGYTLFLASPKGLVRFKDRLDGPASGWFPMVWALTAQHRKELRM